MRQYRKYADLDVVFGMNPVTRDLSLRTDEAAVKFAIKNLIMTRNYERPFNSSIGTQVNNLLFDLMDVGTIIVLKQVIYQSIDNHEPRVDILDIDVTTLPDNNAVNINISFRIKNTLKPLTLNLSMERSR